MNLYEYIHETLLQITNGVHDAQNKAQVHITPALFGKDGKEKLIGPQLIEYEITTALSTEANGGIKVLSIGDAKAAHKNEGIHKICFSVPVCFHVPTKRSPNHYLNKGKPPHSNNEKD